MENKVMNRGIQIDLVKLVDGSRLLRLSHAGLGLEKKLDPTQPVAQQKKRLLRELRNLLSHYGLAGMAE